MIEINGHRYDAVTGKLLDGMQRAVVGVGSVDGIVRAKTRHIKHHSQRGVHSIKRQTQRSQTLMRNVVKKPAVKKSAIKKSLIHHRPGGDLRAKLAGLKPNHKPTAHQPQHHHSVHEGEVVPRQHKTAMAVAAPMPGLSDSLSHQKLERMLDYALTRADSHNKNKHNSAVHKAFHVLPRWLNITIITILVVSIGGFIAWQKIPAISLKVASTMTHLDSSMPNIPGYIVASAASTKNGEINIHYRAISDPSKSVTVTKKTFDKTDAVALANKECPNDKQVQNFQQSGSIGVICGETRKAINVTNGIATEIHSDNAQAIDPDITGAIAGQ